MLERPENALSNLKKVAEVCHSTCNAFTASLMAIVIDVTRPLPRERDKDYIVQLKIVDEVLNEGEVHGILVKYCSVYLFGKEMKDLEVCNQIGQLLYLSSFTFALWNEIKLETKYRSTIEKLYCFTPQGENLIPYRALLTAPQSQQAVLSEEHQHRGRKLLNWFHNSYFYNKYRPNLGINLVNNYCVMAEPFSMILRLSKAPLEEAQLEKALLNHLPLEDSHGNTFMLSRNYLPHSMPLGEYVIVRGIRYIGNFYELNLTETGYLLGLPIGFEELYKEDMNYCGISRFNERFLLRSHKTCNLSKINYVSPKVTPIIDLLGQIELYQNRQSQKEDMRVEDLYMIEAVAINFTGRLNLFHVELQMIIDEDYLASITDDQRNDLLSKNGVEYLYEGVLGVMDRSSECTGKLFYVHLFTNEKRSRFFDSYVIEPLNKVAGQGCNRELEIAFKTQIEQKLQSLIEKSDFTNTISMLLEPIKSDVLLYRLTNTIFI